MIQPNKFYRHLKTGNLFQVSQQVKHSETFAGMVVTLEQYFWNTPFLTYGLGVYLIPYGDVKELTQEQFETEWSDLVVNFILNIDKLDTVAFVIPFNQKNNKEFTRALFKMKERIDNGTTHN